VSRSCSKAATSSTPTSRAYSLQDDGRSAAPSHDIRRIKRRGYSAR
jgi:hypothetical protein